MNNSGSGGISDSCWGIKKRIPQLFLSFLVLAIASVEAVPAPPESSLLPSSSLSPSPSPSVSSPAPSESPTKSTKSQNIVVISVCAAVGVLIVAAFILSLRKLRKRSAAADLPHISKNGVTGVNAASTDLQSELEVTEDVFRPSRDSISLATISSTLSSARLHSLSSVRHSTISSTLSSARIHSLSSIRRYSSSSMRGPLRHFSSLSSARRFSYTQTSEEQEQEQEPAPPSSVSTSPKISPLEEMSDIASSRPGVNENWPASMPNNSLLSVSSYAASESSPSYNEVLKDAPPPPYKKYME